MPQMQVEKRKAATTHIKQELQRLGINSRHRNKGIKESRINGSEKQEMGRCGHVAKHPAGFEGPCNAAFGS